MAEATIAIPTEGSNIKDYSETLFKKLASADIPFGGTQFPRFIKIDVVPNLSYGLGRLITESRCLKIAAVLGLDNFSNLTLSFFALDRGSGAKATAVLNPDNTLSAINVNKGEGGSGYDYKNPPTVLLTYKNVTTPLFNATVNVKGSSVYSIAIKNNTPNPPPIYDTLPTISFSEIDSRHINGTLPGEETWPPADITLYTKGQQPTGYGNMTLPDMPKSANK